VTVQVEATITCPLCGTSALARMPENACQRFYRCSGCGELLKPKDDDCCVFCSYADTPCPPRQAAPQPARHAATQLPPPVA
jgi:hypothetical protein